MKRVAIIGSRDISEEVFHYLSEISKACITVGMEVSTGCADGADYAAMVGARNIDPTKLHVYLPWKTYNQKYHFGGGNFVTYDPMKHTDWTKSVISNHPASSRLSAGAFRLHARNFGIVEHADIVVAMPRVGPNYGGTGQGIRLAQKLDKKLFIVTNQEDRTSLRDLLREMNNKRVSNSS